MRFPPEQIRKILENPLVLQGSVDDYAAPLTPPRRSAAYESAAHFRRYVLPLLVVMQIDSHIMLFHLLLLLVMG
jgi:hypothetical protein